MREEIKIVEVQARGNEKPVKQGKDGYVFPVRYVLEDGRTIDTAERHRLLRDAKKAQSELPRKVNNMKACFSDGKYWGTMRTYSLTGKGLTEQEV